MQENITTLRRRINRTLTKRACRRTLPPVNVKLSPALEEFVQRKIGQGAYASANEMIAASLAMMSATDDEDWKTSAREKIACGLESARAWRVHDPEDVASWDGGVEGGLEKARQRGMKRFVLSDEARSDLFEV